MKFAVSVCVHWGGDWQTCSDFHRLSLQPLESSTAAHMGAP